VHNAFAVQLIMVKQSPINEEWTGEVSRRQYLHDDTVDTEHPFNLTSST